MKVKYSEYLFYLFALFLLVFFIVPPVLQKPIRILIAISFVVLYFSMLSKNILNRKHMFVFTGVLLLNILLLQNGTWSSAYLNISLCLLGVSCIEIVPFSLTNKQKNTISFIATIALVSIVLQMIYLRSADGRPKMWYETNHSGFYLFLFYLYSDVLKIRVGKIVVLIFAMLLRSRSLIFSLMIFYTIRGLKKYNILKSVFKANKVLVVLFSYIVIGVISIWFTSTRTMYDVKEYTEDVTRIVEVDDTSNYRRFDSNRFIIQEYFQGELNNILWGYGAYTTSNWDAEKTGSIMPHNEALAVIVEYGIVSFVFFTYMMIGIIKKIYDENNAEFYFGILSYTLFLWVRILLVPSFEMVFLIMLLKIKKQECKK